MSDREFDNYLTLLAGLLRLDGRQRKQIAEELRAHLDDRLDELVAEGVPHEAAVQQALAEFGDAAGLAASFGKVSRGRKRRWLMRVTTFSIAATILIAAGIFTFWPGRNAAPGVAALVAQAPDPFLPAGEQPAKAQPAAPAADPFLPRPPKKEDARAAKLPPAAVLEAKLNEPTTIDFQEVSLLDAIHYLKDQHQIPLYLKTKKLDEAGVSADTPITKSFAGIRLRSALRHLLEDLDLTYIIQDELILITTPEDAESQLEIRVYDCRDLLAMPAANAVRRVVNNVNVGPPVPGFVPGLGELPLKSPPGYLGLVVDETPDEKGVRVTDVRHGGPAETGGLKPNDTIVAIGGKSIANMNAFDAAIGSMPAGEELKVAVVRQGHTQELALVVGVRSPLPSSARPASGNVEIPLANFAAVSNRPAPSLEGGDASQSLPPNVLREQVINLINIITSNALPKTWSVAGGPGYVTEYNGLFVITQTAHTHKEVERVLDMLREAAGLPGPGKVVR